MARIHWLVIALVCMASVSLADGMFTYDFNGDDGVDFSNPTQLFLSDGGQTLDITILRGGFDPLEGVDLSPALGPVLGAKYGSGSLSPFGDVASDTDVVIQIGPDNFFDPAPDPILPSGELVYRFDFTLGDFSGDLDGLNIVASSWDGSQSFGGFYDMGQLLNPAAAPNPIIEPTNFGNPDFVSYDLTLLLDAGTLFGNGIRFISLSAGSPGFNNSVYYDNFVLYLALAPSGSNIPTSGFGGGDLGDTSADNTGGSGQFSLGGGGDPIPEPSTVVLFGIGAAVVALRRRRKKS